MVKRKTTKEFIKQAIKIHGHKYDYSKANYINTDTKIIIVCPIHGEFLQCPSHHIKGHGCGKCAGNFPLGSETFIKRAREIHGCKYDYSKVNYINKCTKVTIICPEHGFFKQMPSDHMSGKGCAKCAINSRSLSLKEFIHAAKEKHGDKYNYHKIEYVNSREKIIIICPIHGEFLQNPRAHLEGHGCRACAGNLKKTTEVFIKQAKAIHGNHYDYSKSKYVNNGTKIIIICPIHGEFKQYPSGHLNEHGCLDCFNDSRRKSTEKFVQQSKKIHLNKYDYSNVEYLNNYTKVEIICPTHGLFLQNPSGHLMGHGCPECSGSVKKTTKRFVEEAIQIHGNKYDYSKTRYINAQTRVNITCKIHGKFSQFPFVHLKGCGCPKCFSNGRRAIALNNFLDEAAKIHSDKYDYSKVNYINARTKVIIICPKHGEFEQLPCNHLSGKGCSNCSNKISKKSQLWLNSLGTDIREYGIYVGDKYVRVDGYDSKTNTIFEFYGDFWHGNKNKFNPNDINPINRKTFGELYEETIKRENMLKSAGFNLVSIWEKDWDEQFKK